MKNQSGVTLVEVIVAAALMTILGTIMITVLSVSNRQVNTSYRNMKLCMQYETAVDQIAKLARAANCITVPGDTFPPKALSASTGSTLYMRGPTGMIIGGYKVDAANRLNELDTAIDDWKVFKINPSDSGVVVTPGSNFAVPTGRNMVTLNLNVCVSYKNIRDTFTSKGESFLCRNGSLR